MHRKPLLYLACACLVPGSVVEGAQSGRRSLSAQEAVELALAGNPQLVALRKGREASQARVEAATVLPSPEFRLGVSDIVTDSAVSARRQNNVALRWSPPRPGEGRLKMAEARGRAEQVSGEVAVAEQKLAAEVRLLHQTICLLDEQVRIAEETVRLREEILRAVESQVQAGVKSALDRSAAELGVAEARPLPERYRTERRVEMSRLLAKLGLESSADVDVRPEGDILAYTAPSRVREKLLAAAFENRAEIGIARARCTQLDAAAQSLRRERYPWISYVQVSHRLRAGDPSSWGVQVGVDVPVFRWGGKAEKPALAELEQCRLEQQAGRAAVAAELDEILVRLDAAATELEQHRRIMTDLSRRHLEVAEGQLAAGQADLIEPLLARVRQLSAKQSYVARLMDVRALEIGLDQALGSAVNRDPAAR